MTDKERDITKMKDPDSWPRCSYLPIKRGWQTAIITEGSRKGYVNFIPDLNAFANPLHWKELTPEELVSDGWCVD